MKPELRYKYTGSYRDPKRLHFVCVTWMNEEDCRKEIAAQIRSADIAGESLRIIVQHKKSRWLHLMNGTVSEIFPDLIVEFEREQAIKQLLENPTISLTARLDAGSAVRRGVVSESLANAEALAGLLQVILALSKASDAELLSRWSSRNPAIDKTPPQLAP